MEFRVIDTSPQGCFFCRDSRAPYLDAMLSIPQLPTPAGPVALETEVHICIGTADNPGCLPQMIREAGGLDPFKWAETRDAHQATLNQLGDTIANLEHDLAASREREGMKVVPVSEVLDAIGS